MNENERKAKIAKLPKWAQHYIQKLEADLVHAESDKSALFNAVEGDVQVVLPYFRGDNDQPLPSRQGIRFYPDKSKNPWRGFVEARINHSTGLVEIRGADRLMIQPEAANVFSIRLRKESE